MIQEQKENVETNLLTGLPFVIEESQELTDEEKIKVALNILEKISLGEDAHNEELHKKMNLDEATIEKTINDLLKNYEDKEAKDIVDDICKNYANELGYSEDLVRNMLSGYEKEALIELLTETVKEMVVKSYETQAETTIKTIESVPSDSEKSEIKSMIMKELYKAADGKTGVEKEMMIQQFY